VTIRSESLRGGCKCRAQLAPRLTLPFVYAHRQCRCKANNSPLKAFCTMSSSSRCFTQRRFQSGAEIRHLASEILRCVDYRRKPRFLPKQLHLSACNVLLTHWPMCDDQIARLDASYGKSNMDHKRIDAAHSNGQ
jgi:hypothetical protein